MRKIGLTSWRDSRSHKLARQFRDASDGGGESNVADLIGAGSEGFGRDGGKENGSWEIGAPGSRERAGKTYEVW